MKKALFATGLLLAVTCWYWLAQDRPSVDVDETVAQAVTPGEDTVYARLKKEGVLTRRKQLPNDWFFIQRAYPVDSIPY
jgi:hypothetical protein